MYTQQTHRMKNLFLRQSYLDAWGDYERSLTKSNCTMWDYIILTASNDEQADSYRMQIQYRLDNNLLPKNTHYAVIPDPDGKRVGSGGATLNVLKYIRESCDGANIFKDKRILVIHSGGDSKRVPQYSACGKLFSPVPRVLPNGRRSTLFDEFIISMSGLPARMKDGMLILSGDVLLLFNPLQIDLQFGGAAAISIKENVETGKNHGVFLSGDDGNVKRFLHKMSAEELAKIGAINEQGNVDLDTGAVLMDSNMLNCLFELISIDGKNDKVKFDEFVNETVRLSFYGDFLYPLAEASTIDEYYNEAPEGKFCDELKNCRTAIWNVLRNFKMKLLRLSPAEFIHFGTTKELLNLMTTEISDYEFLDWQSNIATNVEENAKFSSTNSFIHKDTVIEQNSYIEDSYILEKTVVSQNCVISNVTLKDVFIPENTVIHGLKLKNGKYVVRIFGLNDNPKGTLELATSFLGTNLKDFIQNNNIQLDKLWDNNEHYLWTANLYPVCDTMEEAVSYALILYKIATGNATSNEVEGLISLDRMSLYSSFNATDVKAILPWQTELDDRIRVNKFISAIENRVYVDDALNAFSTGMITISQFNMLLALAEDSQFSTKIRIYYYLAKFLRLKKYDFKDFSYEQLEGKCFGTIKDSIFKDISKRLKYNKNYKINKDQVDVQLPVRVNWGGGWSDTPPYCNENGGTVLNAAIKLRGVLPVQVTVKKLDTLHIVFESTDSGSYGEFNSVAEIQDCYNPFDPFALHKAALIACGIIPISDNIDLEQILSNLGGGIYLSTQVIGIPRGSGLGTSSILSGACIKGIFEFFGQPITDNEMYAKVLCMEQIMSTGGGWQDQVGGITPGIKFITTKPGITQNIKVENVKISSDTLKELGERFALIYTGQRRLARNLLREVVGAYVGSSPTSIAVLHEIQRVAALIKFELEIGNIDGFAKLLNEHWELSKKLDGGCTNTCIDQIFMSCEDMLDGKFISGAGGGGFLQVILKKQFTKADLQKRLNSVFEDSGVDVWDCEFLT